MEPNNDQDRGWESPGRLIPAAVLIVIGTLFLLGNLHVIPDRNWFDFWPVILIAIGAYKLVDGANQRSHVGGAILLSIGCLLMADNLGYLPVSVWSLWPLALIAIGIGLLLDRIPGSFGGGSVRFETRMGAHPAADGSVVITSIFSGSKRKVTEEFTGAAITCLFGGTELDLRGAVMPRTPTTIHADCMFGGAEIRVPREWLVDMRGVGIFGGMSDETAHPPVVTPETRRLVVKGSAIFGGVVVKN
jgi:hypothetical protein